MHTKRTAKSDAEHILPLKGRRFVCPGARRIEIEEFVIETLPEAGILVESSFTAVSVGTEIYNWQHGGRPGSQPVFPRFTGYCSAGTVLAAGRAVKDVKPGDLVASHGAHASHAVLTEEYYRVPDSVQSREASLLIMAAVSLNGIRKARVQLGESVLVFGVGLVGQLAASLARLAGATPVIAVDLNDFRLEKAGRRGADHLLNPSSIGGVEDLVESVRSLCPEDGANVVIEATGLPAVYPTAVKLACSAGRLVALGSPRGTVEMNFLDEVHLREVAILGAFQPFTPQYDHLYYPWSRKREREMLLRLMATGRLDMQDLITHVAKPEQCLDIYTMLADDPAQALAVLFDWA